jgi:hypothetical protein
VIRVVLVGVDLDRSESHRDVGAVRGHDEGQLPIAHLGKHERRQVDARACGGRLRVLGHEGSLAQEELHHALLARLQRDQIGHVGDERRGLANHRGLVLGEDLVAIGPNGDLRGLFLVRMPAVVAMSMIGLADGVARLAAGGQGPSSTRRVPSQP